MCFHTHTHTQKRTYTRTHTYRIFIQHSSCCFQFGHGHVCVHWLFGLCVCLTMNDVCTEKSQLYPFMLRFTLYFRLLFLFRLLFVEWNVYLYAFLAQCERVSDWRIFFLRFKISNSKGTVKNSCDLR